MVFATSLIGATVLLSGFAAALPMAPAYAPPAAEESSSWGSYDSSKSSESYGAPAPDYQGGAAAESAPAWAESSAAPAWAESSAAPAWAESSAAPAWTSSATAAWESSAAATEAAWTSESAPAATSAPSYGSGSSNWGSSDSGYDSCVQQCLATYGGLSTGTYAPTATVAASEGSGGSGATHTVVVAPTQGVLRYVPFALNASVGDTVLFMWGANNHTVTKSSALTPCNKSADALFASGTHDKDFTFTQVINSTDPTFYYCATPGHCPKGMFGIINPPNAAGAATSVGSMMQGVAANDSSVKAYAAYTTTQTAGTKASTWGTNLDMSQIPGWAQGPYMENVLYTRNLLAANPEIMKDDGTIDLGSMSSTPLKIPEDVTVALAASGGASDSSASAAAPASASTGTAGAAASSPSTEAEAQNSTGAYNGAASFASSKVLVGAVAVFATFMLL